SSKNDLKDESLDSTKALKLLHKAASLLGLNFSKWKAEPSKIDEPSVLNNFDSNAHPTNKDMGNGKSAQEILEAILEGMEDINSDSAIRTVHEQFQATTASLLDFQKTQCFAIAIDQQVKLSSCLIRIPSSSEEENGIKEKCLEVERQANVSTKNCINIFPMESFSDKLIQELLVNTSVIKVEIPKDGESFLSFHTYQDHQRIEINQNEWPNDVQHPKEILMTAFYGDENTTKMLPEA
ncbi:hypothetical protein RFI_39234, partial [Reticulomyxa filosa]